MRKSSPNALLSFRRKNFWILGLIGFVSMLVNGLMLTGPIYMLQVYDRVLSSQSEETLFALTILIAFLFVVMGVLDFARGRFGARYGARLQGTIDQAVFDSALAKARDTGDQQSALQDLALVQRLTSSPMFMALFDLPWTPLFIAAIFLFHPWLGWLAVGGAIVLIAMALMNRLLSQTPIARAASAANSANRLASEVQGQAELLHALGMEANAFRRWQKQRAVALGEGMRASDQVGSFTSASKSMRMFLQSAILGLGAYLVLQAELTAGAMIAGSILLGRALAPIEMAIGQWGMIAEAGQAWNRLLMLFKTQAPVPDRMQLPKPQAALDVSNVSIVPPGSKTPTLRGVHFKIEPGQAIGVIGPSGSGKSTLARALTSVWRPATGEIRFSGAKLEQYDPKALGTYIGYLPQSVTLFEGTIAENIARLSDQPDPEKVVTAAKSADAHEMILNLPDGYDTVVSTLGTQLSGGQIQRIGLARALYGDPVLLVLDEPNSALDNEGSIALNSVIKRVKQDGRAVVIMAHRPAAIQECDKLLVLYKGVQNKFGQTQEVLQQTVANVADIRATTRGAP
jgi:ATP-binding cassette subfamily C protein